jgi:hypothetical protein
VRSTAVLLLSCLAASVGLVTVAPAANATTDTAIAVPLSQFVDLVVDDAHGHVFLSGGASDGIVVRDLEGGAVATVPNEPGAWQMALSYDASTLFVALRTENAISAIDTTTLTETARYSVGAACPSSVAFASGKIWFGYGCDPSGTNVGVVDPTPATPTVTLGVLPHNAVYYPEVLSTPSKPGLLVIADLGVSPGLIQLADVSTGTAVLGVSRTDAEPARDLALSPDGARIITPDGHVYLTSDLSADGSYPNNDSHPMGYAAGPNGLAAQSELGWSGKDIFVSRADRTVVRSYETGGCCNQGQSGSVASAGLAFSGDGTHLYAVTTDYLGNTVQLRVLHDPAVGLSAIVLTKPSTASINHAFSIAGKIGSLVAIPAGTVVTIQRDSTYGTVNLPSRVTGSGGTFTISDTVTKRGTYGYRATYVGDADHLGTTTRILMNVLGLATTVSITTSAGPYNYGAKPLVVAHLGATKVRVLSIYAQPYGGTKSRLKTGTVDSHGNVSVAYTMTRRTTFTATFAGDDTYEPRSYAKAFTSRAKVVSWIYGAYATSGAYKLVHASVDPSLLVAVSPNNAGACVSYLAQRYYSGAWHNAATLSCDYLDGTSHGGATYYTNVPAGTRFRMRATFSGSALNVATQGTWQYGKFTS